MFMKNTEIQNIMKIMGLQVGKKYDDMSLFDACVLFFIEFSVQIIDKKCVVQNKVTLHSVVVSRSTILGILLKILCYMYTLCF